MKVEKLKSGNFSIEMTKRQKGIFEAMTLYFSIPQIIKELKLNKKELSEIDDILESFGKNLSIVKEIHKNKID